MDQEFINQLAEMLSKLGTKRPLGFHYAHPFGAVPPDSIQCNGAEYNRTLYTDFFAYATEQGWVKTETEWQEIASQNNGYCSYYSDGDGSTTFRTPKFAPFMQVATASGSVGNYHEAGLPNIHGQMGDVVGYSSGRASGCFTRTNSGTATLEPGPLVCNSKIQLDASLNNAIFGSSSTAQPESSEWMICVVVFGIATNVGSTDVGNVMSAVAQVQAELPNKLNTTTPHIVDTWKSGSDWYRVWSDGFIEQGGLADVTNASGGKEVTFLKAFSTVVLNMTATVKENTQGSYLALGCFTKGSISLTGATIKALDSTDTAIKAKVFWYACGY